MQKVKGIHPGQSARRHTRSHLRRELPLRRWSEEELLLPPSYWFLALESSSAEAVVGDNDTQTLLPSDVEPQERSVACSAGVEGAWQRVQQRSASSQLAEATQCFLRAYQGVDYLESLCQFFECFHLRDRPFASSAEKMVVLAEEKADLCYLLDCLVLLYHRHGDPGLLEFLLELPYSEAQAKEAHMETIATLWQQDACALLMAANEEPARIETLASALAWRCQHDPTGQSWGLYYRELQRACWWRLRPLGKVARAVSAAFCSDWNNAALSDLYVFYSCFTSRLALA